MTVLPSRSSRRSLSARLVLERLEIREVPAVTWQVQSDFFGTRDTVSQARSLRGLALTDDSASVYTGFIQGTTSSAVRKTGSGVLATPGTDTVIIGNTPTPFGTNPQYTGGLDAFATIAGSQQPKGLDVDDRGFVYATLNSGTASASQSVRIYNSSLSAIAGSFTSTASASQLGGLAVHREGSNYYAYIARNGGLATIERWNVTNVALPVLDTAWGTGGRVDLKSVSGWLNAYCNGLDVGDDGTLYVTGGIQSTTRGDSVFKIAASGSLAGVARVDVSGAMDAAYFRGKLYVTQYLGNSSAVAVLNAADLTSAGTLNPGFSRANADGSADFGYSGIDVSFDGRLYVADQLYTVTTAASTYTPPATSFNPSPAGITGTRVNFDRVLVSSQLVAPTTVYVDDDFVGLANGMDVTVGAVTATIGYDAFPTIQGGIGAVDVGGTVLVGPGTYPEAVAVNKSVTVQGDATTRPTVTAPAGSNQKVFTVTASNVTLQSLNVVVNRPNAAAGVYADAGATNAVTGLIVRDNVFTSTGTGSSLVTPYGTTSAAAVAYLSSGAAVPNQITLQGNQILAGPSSSLFSRGIWLREVQATVGGATAALGNSVVSTTQDLLVQFAFTAGGTTTIQNNTFTGAGVDLSEPNAGVVNVVGNQFAAASPLFAQSLVIKHNYLPTSQVNVQGNTFTGHTVGIVSGNSANVLIEGNTLTPGASNATNILIDTRFPTGSTATQPPVAPATTFTNAVTLRGNILNGGGFTGSTGLAFFDRNADPNTFFTPASIVAGGAGAQVNTFAADLARFIALDPTSSAGPPVSAPFAVSFDASSNLFGVAGAGSPILTSAMTTAQLTELESKVFHRPDDPALGRVGLLGNTVVVVSTGAEGVAPTATSNDYTRINEALRNVQAGQTVRLVGTFDWTEANAAASWALGSDGVGGNGDDYAITVPVNVNGVTLTAGALGEATIQGPGDLAAVNLEGFLTFDGGDNQNWTISNLEILDFDLGIGFFNGAGGIDAFNGTTITNNRIRIATDLNATAALADVNQNIGIHYSFGTNQRITNNEIIIPGDGVSDSAGGNFSTSVGMQSNTSGGAVYDGLEISGNTIRVLNAPSADPESILGIWENGQAHLSNIRVANNRFLNDAAGNSAAANLQRAFRVTSHSSATTSVVYENNEVVGANTGFQWLAGQAFAGNQPVRLIGNTLTNTGTGVLVQSGGLASLFRNTITGSTTAGVQVDVGTLAAGAAGSASAAENVITGGAAGIVLGAGAAVTAPISGNDLSGNTGFALSNAAASAVDASANWWGSNTLAGVQGEISGPVDYSPFLDAGSDTSAALGFQGDFSFLHVTAAGSQTAGLVQEAIDLIADDARTGRARVVDVLAGTYVGNLTVDRALTLRGPNVTFNPNVGPQAPQAIIVPGSTDVAGGVVIAVTASNVTIQGLTIDGNNAALSGGAVLNGVDVDAASGVSNAAALVSGLEVRNNIIRNLALNGVLGELTAGASGDNVIAGNLIDNLPSLSPRGRGVLLGNNFYAQVTGNAIFRAGTGIQTNNFSLANPGALAPTIAGNTVGFYARGIFHNLHYQAATNWTIEDNDLAAEATATATNGGIFVFSIQDGVGVTLRNNDVLNAHFGIELWNLPTTATVTVEGGTLTNNAVGVLATNTDSSFGAGSATTAVLDGVTIVGATQGVVVEDLPAGTAAVALTVRNSRLTGNGTGVEVTGSRASLELLTSTVEGSTGDGVHITSGTAVTAASRLTGNLFLGNTTAVRHDGSGPLDARNNYWNSPLGPTHALNPGGTGEAVVDVNSTPAGLGSGVVDYSDVLLTPTGTAGFQVTVSATGVRVGEAFTVTVTARKAAIFGGGVDTAYTGTVSLALAGVSGTLPATITFAAVDAGVRSFSVTPTAAAAGATVTATDAAASPVTGTSPAVSVTAADTTVTFTVSPTAVTGQPVTFQATVTATAPGSGTPTGTVEFRSGATVLATATLVGGVASVSAPIPVGDYAVTAVYLGTADFATSTATPTQALAVSPASTVTTVTGPSSLPEGQSGAFVVTVAALAPGAGTPGGTVTILEGAVVLGSGPLVGGQATLTITLAPGSHTLVARFDGSPAFGVSTSGGLGVAISPAPVSPPVPPPVTPPVTAPETPAPVTQVTLATVTGNAFGPLAGVLVATFTHGDNTLPATAFTATITWGDGATTTGTVVALAGGYRVTGSHTYTDDGSFPLSVTVTSADGALPAGATGSALIAKEVLPAPFDTDTGRLVLSLYRNILGRGVSSAEFTNGSFGYWVAILEARNRNGGLVNTRASVVNLFLQTDEAVEVRLQALYQEHLGRALDDTGRTFFGAFLKNGGDIAEAEAMIVGSAEFISLHGGTSLAALDAVYQAALDRDADPAGEAVFGPRLLAGGSLTDVALTVFQSNEYHTRLLEGWYRQFLGRELDATGRNVWLPRLNAVDDPFTVLAEILGEPVAGEYFQLVI